MDTSASLLESLRVEPEGIAWQTLCDLYSPMLRNWLIRNGASQSDVEDLVQDVLVVIVRRIPDFQRGSQCGSFRSWLKTITINCLRDHWRRKKRQDISPGGTDFVATINQLADPHSGVSKLWDQEYKEQTIHYLLNQIQAQFSEKTRLAFQRFVLDDLSADKVAQELDMSPNAVFIAKSRVMACLREYGQGLID
ncbi:MAG: sigma-70 family RNA polymerase sigma factor [Planctomycetes bacterium]|nr:sigma-70 family RNA polymerase sigma factor [Planctomycetota bacterium]MCH9778016.1 sigma-70 family RNA polymerase sigma factor [Planctomycetota bacterium]MCH9790829.1 sigma-70 family RNA polymerase sigma factor [Planctomycetota bacterium]